LILSIHSENVRHHTTNKHNTKQSAQQQDEEI